MTYSPGEIRCAEAVARVLSAGDGTEWKLSPGPRPDELHPNSPSPDAILTNGALTAAVEVTELKGTEWNSQWMYAKSLGRALCPPGEMSFILVPASNCVLPWPELFVRTVKRAIKEAAKSPFAEGESRPVLIPREALVSLGSPKGSHVYCCHDSLHDVLSRCEGAIPGTFMLVDCDHEWEHEFMSESGRQTAAEAIIAACRARVQDGHAIAKWDEEWMLAEAGPGNVVDLLYVTTAADMYQMSAGDVFSAIDRKARKFTRRWADVHVLALDVTASFLNVDYARRALASFSLPEDIDIDLIVWISNKAEVVLLNRGRTQTR